MAIQNATLYDSAGDSSVITAAWTLTVTDTGSTLGCAAYADKSVQVGVTGDVFNAGTILIEGSLDGTTWSTLTTNQGSPLVFTAFGLAKIQDHVIYIRPRASIAVTSVRCLISARRATPMRT